MFIALITRDTINKHLWKTENENESSTRQHLLINRILLKETFLRL